MSTQKEQDNKDRRSGIRWKFFFKIALVVIPILGGAAVFYLKDQFVSHTEENALQLQVDNHYTDYQVRMKSVEDFKTRTDGQIGDMSKVLQRIAEVQSAQGASLKLLIDGQVRVLNRLDTLSDRTTVTVQTSK